MTRTLPALSALAITLSLLVFALLQRATAAPPVTGACLVEAPAESAPVAPVPAEAASCGDETALASAQASR